MYAGPQVGLKCKAEVGIKFGAGGGLEESGDYEPEATSDVGYAISKVLSCSWCSVLVTCDPMSNHDYLCLNRPRCALTLVPI